MTEESSSPDPPNIGRSRSGLVSKTHGAFHSPSTVSALPPSAGPVSDTFPTRSTDPQTLHHNGTNAAGLSAASHGASDTSSSDGLDKEANCAGASAAPVVLPRNCISGPLPDTAYAQAEGSGPVVRSGNEKPMGKVGRFFKDVYRTFKSVIFHSWINWLLVFVPAGIIVKIIPGVHPGVIFGMNCIAIVPLAGLLSHATEAVAHKMGDSIGALLNITFGNAVELIIFMYVSLVGLIKTRKSEKSFANGIIRSIESQIILMLAAFSGEIRIVQASLLGSILANLLLILGMCFLLGGLRFREQIYNSTVTQMSACLLSLSVISLVLPTAFHASFSSQELADSQSLKISRGTSVILLLVYIIYLMFQLKSHAYLYQSTPQHIVDAESQPGPAASWLDSSDSDSDSSSSSDSDGSNRSRDTIRNRVRKVLRSGRKRKSSVASVDSEPGQACLSTRTPSFGTTNVDEASEGSSAHPHLPHFNSVSVSGAEEAVDEEYTRQPRRRHRKRNGHSKRRKSKRTSKGNLANGEGHEQAVAGELATEQPEPAIAASDGEPRRVDFALQSTTGGLDGEARDSTPSGSRRPLTALKGVSVRHLVTPTVFAPESAITPAMSSGPVPRVRYGIRRTNSLPDRLNQSQIRAPGGLFPAQVPMASLASAETEERDEGEEHISNVAAVIILLISTGLVAVCAEFLVDSINDVVHTSPVGEIFIGLIILPIVGNAAEHVTAITVAMKNKMDLAIGVAVGSSIQIALFVTPFIVILGWIINRDMTLYFTLFETVCLFVSTFIVNFLVLDGRSNYLEGALLCSTYIIISVVAFFYPDAQDASSWGA